MEYLSTKEVAELAGFHISTVQKWAVINNVKSEGLKHRKTFFWTNEDVEKFKKRNRKIGRPKKNK